MLISNLTGVARLGAKDPRYPEVRRLAGAARSHRSKVCRRKNS